MLHMKKCIMKSVIGILSFLRLSRKKTAEGINFILGKSIVFYIRRKQGSNVTVKISTEKRAAFLIKIIFFFYQGSINKNPSLLFVGDNAFSHNTFD